MTMFEGFELFFEKALKVVKKLKKKLILTNGVKTVEFKYIIFVIKHIVGNLIAFI